jgi:Holliday junction resolvase RusA-like endonuclease
MRKIYVIPGDPLPLARARCNYNTRRVYDIQASLKLVYGIYVQQQHGDLPLLHGPLHLDVTFFMRMPHANRTHKKYAMHGPHFIKPDLSNLIKLIEDISNQIIYQDDAQISYITSRKIYHSEPRTEFSVLPLKKDYIYENH